MKITKKCLQIKKKPNKIYCNKCGEEMQKDSNGYFPDYLEVQKNWGYFSDYDGQTHYFDICQDCYHSFIESFAIPVDKSTL